MSLLFKIKKAALKVYVSTHRVKDVVLFDSFDGKQYSDNPRAISEALHNLYPKHKIVWYIKSPNKFDNVIPSYVEVIRNKRRYYKYLSTCFCYVRNCEFFAYHEMFKRKNQIYIQTWHGDRPFKKILYTAQDDVHKKLDVADDKVTDYAIAGSKFGVQNYVAAFHYNGKILNIGMPREEKMLEINSNESQRVNIKKEFGINENTKVLLYAPTFRDNSSSGEFKVDIDLDIVKKSLEEKYRCPWIAIIRGHVGKRLVCNSDCIDLTNYPDMTDILGITDFLITDYSSSICDFALTDKPALVFSSDEEEYQKTSRKFAVAPQECGFIVAKSNEELIKLIRECDINDYKRSYKNVNEYYGTTNPVGSTEKIVKIIDEFYRNKK